MPEFGYAGEILKVDLSGKNITKVATSDYANRFIGGRGFATRLYWDMVPDAVRALEPENCLLYMTGPTAGFSGIAGGRLQICGKSPAHDLEAFSYANLGGKWGIALKSAGFDGLAVQGKADKPAYLYIHDGTVEIRDASALWGQSAFNASDSIKAELGKEVSVLTIGPAAENRVTFATMLADQGASGSGGLGSVMGSKRLKAIAVVGDKNPIAFDRERLRRISECIRNVRRLRGPPLAEIHGITSKIEWCARCGIGCARLMYSGEKGRRYKFYCQASQIYKKPATEYFGGWNEVQLEAVRLCDDYSLDTAVMQPLISWLIDCYREGIINEKETGLPLSRAGSVEFIEMLIRMIARREGFGDVLARGTSKAAESIGGQAKELLNRYVASRSSETSSYEPRLYLTTALLYATEPRRPINQLHGVSWIGRIWSDWSRGAEHASFTIEDIREVATKFWGSAIAADFSTCEGKALAAKKIQDRCYAQESLILCDAVWPMMLIYNTESRVADPTIASQIFAAITGREIDETGLMAIGERICNLQRAIQLRQGWQGRKDDLILDCFHEQPLKHGDGFNPDALVPGPDCKLISRIGCVVDRDEFEKMKTEYYQLRDWDIETGFPTRTRLKKLGLGDIVDDLAKRGLLD